MSVMEVSKTTKIAVGAAILAVGGFSGIGLRGASSGRKTLPTTPTAPPAVADAGSASRPGPVYPGVAGIVPGRRNFTATRHVSREFVS